MFWFGGIGLTGACADWLVALDSCWLYGCIAEGMERDGMEWVDGFWAAGF